MKDSLSNVNWGQWSASCSQLSDKMMLVMLFINLLLLSGLVPEQTRQVEEAGESWSQWTPIQSLWTPGTSRISCSWTCWSWSTSQYWRTLLLTELHGSSWDEETI